MGVPNTTRVPSPIASAVSASSSAFAMPKSSTIGWVRPFLTARKMFDGLRSRCVTPRRCPVATASHTENKDIHRLGDGHRARTLQPAGEIFAFQQLHDEIDPLELLARVDDLHDIRVSNAGGQPRFSQESSASDRLRGKLAAQHLDRDALAVTPAHALVNDAHRSDAQAAPDLVFADPRSKQERGN